MVPDTLISQKELANSARVYAGPMASALPWDLEAADTAISFKGCVSQMLPQSQELMVKTDHTALPVAI